ncbi:MAG: 4-oxalocrotonate tautomerase family protein [Nitrospira sp.]
MPYVLMQVTREGVTVEQKEALIKGVTELLVQVLNKTPAQTFVVIQEVETDNWGVAGMTVTKFRQQERQDRWGISRKTPGRQGKET